MHEVLDRATEVLLWRSLNGLPPGRRAAFEETWRAELGGIPEAEERLRFARGLPAAGRRLGWQFDHGARFMRVMLVLVCAADLLIAAQPLLLPSWPRTGPLSDALVTYTVGLHLMLLTWALIRVYRREIGPVGVVSARTRKLWLAGLVAGLLCVAAGAVWRSVLNPAAFPFLPFLLLCGLATSVQDLAPDTTDTTRSEQRIT